jgi:glycosyltransferase involved in cell wall biosynthesis
MPMRVLVVGLASLRNNQPSGSVPGGVWLANALYTKALIYSGSEVTVLSADDGEPFLPSEVDPKTYSLIRYKRPRVNSAIASKLGSGLRLAALRIKEDLFLKRAMINALRTSSMLDQFSHVVFLGTPPIFKLPGATTIAYIQSLPRLELQALWRARQPLLAYGGGLKLVGLAAYQVYRMVRDHVQLKNVDHLIIASELLSHYAANYRYSILPYPIASANPAGNLSDHLSPKLLWLGRIVPRKRFDLLCGAYTLLRQEGSPLPLVIIGGFSAFPELHSILEGHPYREHIDYIEQLSHEDALQHIDHQTIVVQPSDNEVMGSVIPEALARGAQVVLGERNGTLPKHHASGTWFGEYTCEAVAEAIRKAIAKIDTGIYREQSIKTHKELFDIQHVSAEFIRIVSSTPSNS